eukprot:303618-Prorocentrum_minimum.AAC.3
MEGEPPCELGGTDGAFEEEDPDEYRVVEGKGLPPGVDAVQRGIVSLELSNITWELRGAPTHPIARLKWWGQKKKDELNLNLWEARIVQVR